MAFAIGSPGASSDEIAAFFTRCGLAPTPAQSACHDFAAARFCSPPHNLGPAPVQGYCSYTLLGDDLVVQFRPERHRLDMDIAGLATRVFGDLAPSAEYLGIVTVQGGGGSSRQPATSDDAAGEQSAFPILHAYALARVPGVSLAGYRCGGGGRLRDNGRDGLVRSFARLWARGWADRVPAGGEFERGPVGSSIGRRLEKMMAALPGEFRGVVGAALVDLDQVLALPWVLSHGDLLPANIMVDPRNGRLSGLIDWAEAEWLPFGVGFYGLEELLGEDVSGVGFRYYLDAEWLRQVFWAELYGTIPSLGNKVPLSLLRSAQAVGILLWHGIAFDDGLLDRVVEEGRDEGDVQRLRTFLLEPKGPKLQCGAKSLAPAPQLLADMHRVK
jgi:hypothetical protein